MILITLLSGISPLHGKSAPQEDQQIPVCMLSYKFGPEHHIVIVEKSTQRLMVFSNYQPSPVATFKITTGKNGGPKLVEGDMKTPEGIYFPRRIISGNDLPKSDDYGEKAFTLNYPNKIDRLAQKNGSGIWLHGAYDPDKTKSPNNSRGCVVMSNNDLVEVSKYIFLNRTPICIYDKIEYAPFADIVKKRERLMKYLKGWKTSWESKNIDSYIDYYMDSFSYRGMNLSRYKTFKNNLNKRYKFIRVFLSDISLYAFDHYHVALFNQLYISDLNHFYSKKIQYWKETENKSKIADELSFTIPQPGKFQFTKGNYSTINEFRKDYLEEIKASTVTFSPPGINIKNISIFGETVKITLQKQNHRQQIKALPVLKLENIKTGEIMLSPPEGVTLDRGQPRDFSKAVELKNMDTLVVMKKDKEYRLSSLTLFLVNHEDTLQQIITYFVEARD
jgi:murein L,D-transpeptidase YafK